MVDVEKVLLSLDISLVAQRGEEVQGLCPMHKARTGKEDHNPSWWINSVTGAHICFSCGYKGNVYTLVADVKGMDYFDAKDYVTSSAELDVDVLLKRIRELPQYVTITSQSICQRLVLLSTPTHQRKNYERGLSVQQQQNITVSYGMQTTKPGLSQYVTLTITLCGDGKKKVHVVVSSVTNRKVLRNQRASLV